MNDTRTRAIVGALGEIAAVLAAILLCALWLATTPDEVNGDGEGGIMNYE